MASITTGAGELANELLPALVAGKDFSIPEINLDGEIFDQPTDEGPLYEAIEKIDFENLTSGEVCGTGVFDKLMKSLVAHLQVEFEANRISGAEYTKAYIGIISAALQTAQQFVLNKDQSYWAALLVQAQARTANVETIRARVDLETGRVMAARAQYEAATAEANYALTKIKLATEDATFGNLTKQGEGITFTNSTILPKQSLLLQEQIEGQRAQTHDVRTDGIAVAGSIGKQKELYSQQITSYKRDAEFKGIKLWVDAWITQKTMDEGLLAPDQFTNTNLDQVLSKMRDNLDLNP